MAQENKRRRKPEGGGDGTKKEMAQRGERQEGGGGTKKEKGQEGKGREMVQKRIEGSRGWHNNGCLLSTH